MMKRILLILILIFSLSGLLDADSIKSYGRTSGSRYHITIESEVECMPDTLCFVFGINTSGLSASTAFKENKEIWDKVKKVMKDKRFDKFKQKQHPPEIKRQRRTSTASYNLDNEVLEFKVDRWIVLTRNDINKKNMDAILSEIAVIMDILSESGINLWDASGRAVYSSSSIHSPISYICTDYEKNEKKAYKQAEEYSEEAKKREEENTGIKLGKLSSRSRNRIYYQSSSDTISLPKGPRSVRFEGIMIKATLNIYYEVED